MKSDKLIDAIGGVREDYLEALTEGREAFEVQEGGRGMSRRSFVRIGVAAAAVGVGAFLGLSIFGKGGEKSFVLTAYAEGTDQGDGSVLPLANWAGDGCWGPGVGDNCFDACFSFKLGCTIEGDGAESVTYELEGPYCKAWETPADDGVTRVSFFDGSDGSEVTRITVPFEKQATKNTQIYANFPATESLRELDGRFQAYEEETRQRAVAEGTNLPYTDWDLDNEYRLGLRMAYNEYLATATLHISVSYADGTVLEKRYAIAAIDDFEAVYGAYLKRSSDGYLAYEAGKITREETNAITLDQPQLYTIRELEG